jgi:hypothetical protein
VRLRFVGADRWLQPDPAAIGPRVISDLIGRDPSQWTKAVSTLERVTYRNVWPHIDVTFQPAHDRVKYSILVRPGGRLADVRFAYDGSTSVRIAADGGLVVTTGYERLRDPAPIATQQVGGVERPAAVRLVIRGDATVGFAAGPDYDRSAPLLIDSPVPFISPSAAVRTTTAKPTLP